MKKTLSLISLAAVAGSLAIGGAFLGGKTSQIKQANAEVPSYQTYVPLIDGWVEHTDGSDAKSVSDLLRGRNERFWSGNANPNNWDSQERTFNSMDQFIDTIHRAGGEGWRGAYRTPELVLADNDHRYISFLFGGGSGDIFINIFQVSGEAGSGDRITGIRTAFDESGTFDDKVAKLNAPISCNMVFKYYELPNEIQPGDHFLIYVRDGKTSDYGGFTFGNVHINQTLQDVAKGFSAHKQQMLLNKYTSDWNANAIDYVLNFYANNSYYSTVRTAEAALVDANDGFDVNNHLTDWAYDNQFSTAGIDFNYVMSDNDAKDWDERMPANKTGERYFNADATHINESEKYRIVSHEFTLSGTGFISAKLGGGTAVLSLIDSNGDELVSSRIAASENENILNPGFVNNEGVGNIMASGSRFNTMSRTYLDASAHLGKKVRVVLSDDRTGGNWGLAYFDEVITKYDTVPTLKVDRIQQQFGDNPTYYGVVTDKYVGLASTDFGKAYAFVQDFYALIRNASNGVTYCNQELDLTALRAEFNALPDDAKDIVNGSEDYDFKNSLSNWYDAAARQDFTIGDTLVALGGFTGAVATSAIQNPIMRINSADTQTAIIVVSVIAITLTLGVLGYYRKRKENR